MPDESDVKIGQLPQYHSTIVAAVAKYPLKRANALSTVLQTEYGLLVKWKALETYCLRQNLWTLDRPKPPVPKFAVAMASTSAASASTAASTTIIDAKIGDLPAHRERILLAIRSNPGSKAIALAAFLEKTYSVRVHFQALRKYIERENLFEAATTAPCTPIRSTGAPATPIGAPMQASPARTPRRSPGKKVHAKIGDLPRYKHRIVAAIKANPGKRKKQLSAELERNYALVVHFETFDKYCTQHDL